MATLTNKIRQYVGSEVDFTLDVKLQNDGQGDYIKEWNLDTAQPTQAQLDALETQADDYEFNLGQIAKRKAEYGNAESQMENIIENGLEAEQTRIQSIKDKYPKR
jgi:RPA family protein